MDPAPICSALWKTPEGSQRWTQTCPAEVSSGARRPVRIFRAVRKSKWTGSKTLWTIGGSLVPRHVSGWELQIENCSTACTGHGASDSEEPLHQSAVDANQTMCGPFQAHSFPSSHRNPTHQIPEQLAEQGFPSPSILQMGKLRFCGCHLGYTLIPSELITAGLGLEPGS